MSKVILRDQRIFLDAYELTTKSNAVSIEASKDTPECPTFGTDWRQRSGDGLKDFTFGCGGYMEIGEVEEYIFSEIGSDGIILTVTPQTQIVGGIAFNMQAIESSLSLFGKLGDVAPFQIGAAGNSIMGKGVLLALPGTSVTATGDTIPVQIAGTAAGKKLKMTLHVLSASGTDRTLSVKLQSDSASGFASASDLVTSKTYTEPGAEYTEVTLSSEDAHFRLSYTVTGATPSFDLLCSISII